MTNWGRTLIRSFGVLHLIYGVVGILFLLYALYRLFPDGTQLSKYPYERQIYYLCVALEVSLISILMVAGVWLIRMLRRGVTLTNYLFIVEIGFWAAYSLFSLGLKMHGGNAADLGMSMGAVAGVGGMATGVQLITGYPFIALVGLNLARRQLDREGSWAPTD